MPQYQHITHNYRPKRLELLRIVATFAAAMCKAVARNLTHNATQSIITFISHNSYTMYLDSEKKKEIFGKYGQSNSDTGSVESQVALFSYRIAHLTEHMKQNRKDHTTERSLVKMVGKRRALLNYLKRKDIERYRAIVKNLGLRK